MKNSKLFLLSACFVIVNSLAIAGNTRTGVEDTTAESSEELYVDPLEELLAMEGIPTIIMDSDDVLNLLNEEVTYINPLEEVLAMESIPTIEIKDQNTFTVQSFDAMEVEEMNPLQEVLAMEQIPTIQVETNTVWAVQH